MRQHPLWAVVPALATLASASVIADVTYYKDVVPILQTHCQQCHGSYRLAPIPLFTYRQARLWADEVKQTVIAESMPPRWSEETSGQVAQNHGHLTARERDTIIRWVDEGAQAGDPRDAPPSAYVSRRLSKQPRRATTQEPDLP
jgi:hypothetical protein